MVDRLRSDFSPSSFSQSFRICCLSCPNGSQLLFVKIPAQINFVHWVVWPLELPSFVEWLGGVDGYSTFPTTYTTLPRFHWLSSNATQTPGAGYYIPRGINPAFYCPEQIVSIIDIYILIDDNS